MCDFLFMQRDSNSKTSPITRTIKILTNYNSEEDSAWSFSVLKEFCMQNRTDKLYSSS